MLLNNYFDILFFSLLSLLLALLIIFLPFLFALKIENKEKLSSYECGFSPFEDSRSEFEVKFYLIGILFIIFDLEISFLFPLAVSIQYSTYNSVFSVLIFVIVLIIGFFYEWQKGALD
mmetsp:Transcript_20305/g.39509  ORF Transcript_20305/g.39509 Transcript_20305/m.39509 type:complete len:118 (+) Transcript_20305:40-393(+)